MKRKVTILLLVMGSLFLMGAISIPTITHNTLDGLQGGQSGQYYHLTAANYTSISDWDAAYTHSQIAGGDSVHVSTTENTNWDTAYGWGDHSAESYMEYNAFSGDVYTLDTAGITLTAGTLTAEQITSTDDMDITGTLTANTGSINVLTTTQIQGLTDSVSAPTYSFFGDSSFDTGMYRYGEDSIGFSCGGVNRAVIGAIGLSVGNLRLASGSITDSSNAIDFGNEALSTTGTLSAGQATITKMNLGGGLTTFVLNGVSLDAIVGATSQIATELQYVALQHSNVALAGSRFMLSRSRGTLASPLIVAENDSIAAFDAAAYDGTDYVLAGEIDFEVDGESGGNDMPGRIVFKTTADGGILPAAKWTIKSTGDLLSGTDGTGVYNILTAGTLGCGATTITVDGTPQLILKKDGSNEVGLYCSTNGKLSLDATSPTMDWRDGATQYAQMGHDTSNCNFYNYVGSFYVGCVGSGNVYFRTDNSTKMAVWRDGLGGDVSVYNELKIGSGDRPANPLDMALTTEDFDIVDAGSVDATEQDWVEVLVGGNTGYIRVYAAK